jgi:ABC-type multidrug transport system fused ATPase/permease subunit
MSDEIQMKDSDVFNTDPRARVFTMKCLSFLRQQMFGQDTKKVISIKGSDIKEIEDAVNKLINERNLLYFENATRLKYKPSGRYNFLPKYPIYYAIFLMISFFSSLFALVLALNDKFYLLLLVIPIFLLVATIISILSIIMLSRRKFRLYGRW